MRESQFKDAIRAGGYRTSSGTAGRLAAIPGMATVGFYSSLLRAVVQSTHYVRRHPYTLDRWLWDSLRLVRTLEYYGATFVVQGTHHVGQAGPAVIAANHMSSLETVALPCILLPWRPCSFIVKSSLLEYPMFGEILQQTQPVAVSRQNPRHDLKTVLEEGTRLLGEGRSVVIFPQSTRTPHFAPDKFSTLAVKLAKRAGAPLVPLALKTDLWGNGRFVKELGPIDTRRPARFAFGEGFPVTDNGKVAQQRLLEFIGERLAAWETE